MTENTKITFEEFIQTLREMLDEPEAKDGDWDDVNEWLFIGASQDYTDDQRAEIAALAANPWGGAK